MDKHLLEAVGEDVTRLARVAEADARHYALALETAADAIVDTLGLAPARADADVAVRLMASEGARSLLRQLYALAANKNHVDGGCLKECALW